MPARLGIEMVYATVFWLNSFSTTEGISQTLSPQSIVTGLTINFEKNCKLELGTDVQTHEEHDNSMMSRTTRATALRSMENVHWGYYFMSLTRERRLARYSWTLLPMPQDAIYHVLTISRTQNNMRGLIFTDSMGNTSDKIDEIEEKLWNNNENSYVDN
jgi:hypothetical protein